MRPKIWDKLSIMTLSNAKPFLFYIDYCVEYGIIVPKKHDEHGTGSLLRLISDHYDLLLKILNTSLWHLTQRNSLLYKKQF